MNLEYMTDLPDAPREAQSLLGQVVRRCAEIEGLAFPVWASLRVVDDDTIQTVNRETRGVDRSTDVLSFPTVSYPKGTARDNEKRVRREYDPEKGACFLGDILLSLPKAREQAVEYGHSLKREMCYLTAHAMFHLMGYDHETDGDKAVMRAMEERALYGLASRDEDSDWSEPDFGAKPTDEQLYRMACDALRNAYAPYSNCYVGAAILCENGRVYTGANVENASYGATICAERSAACAAVSDGERRFLKIAIAGSGWVAWPCGMCRQVLAEFGSADMPVLAGQTGKPFERATLGDLLPKAFGPEEMLPETRAPQ